MSKKFLRVRALLVSAVMAASSVAVTSGEAFSALAAGKEVAIGKTLVTSIPDPAKPDGDPTNVEECTYMCAPEKNQWTAFTDTPGKTPADVFGTGITSLQFNFKAAQMVTDFSYYFGASADEAHDYWWDTNSLTEDGEAIKCTPYASEFSVVVELPSEVDLTKDDSKFQIQNCYTGLIDETDQSTRTQDAEIELVSITVNGTTDTSMGEKPGWIVEIDPTLPTGAENTGGWYYSSANGNGETYSVEQNGDSATVKTLNSLKIDGLDIKLTPGDNYSEEYYSSDAFADANGGTKLTSEAAIREAGLPLNSHKFTYSDFNFLPGKTVATNAKVKSLSLTLKTEGDASVKRVMYGGGLNVGYKSLADTEYAKLQAGVKDDINAGYWYNDIGANALKECTDAGVEWGNGVGEFAVGGGSDLAKQEVGGYFTVTWDVPEQVVDCATTKTTDQISFQLWYGELVEGKFDGATIVDATLTYEESVSFPCTGTASVKNAGSAAIGSGGVVKVPYADFGMEYDKTADVYAVQFDVTTSDDANQVQVGAGTTVLEKLGIKDNWFQTDDSFKVDDTVSHPALLYWEKSTAGSRPDPTDDTLETAPYQAPTGTKTYTYMWIIPPTVAEGMVTDAATNAVKSAWNNVNTEGEDAHLEFGVWYANLGETASTKFDVSNVTVYYAADDKNNSGKTDMFEDELTVVDSIDLQLGESAVIEVNVPGCTVTSKDKNTASAKIDTDGNVNVTGNNVGTTILTITTPGGQTKDVTVNVLAEVTTTTTETTTTTTTTETTAASSSATTAKTTASTTKQTGTTTTEELVPLYGDVNCDGRVDISDAVLLNKAVAGTVNLSTAQQQLNADCDANSEQGSNDAIVLLKFLVSLIKSLPATD